MNPVFLHFLIYDSWIAKLVGSWCFSAICCLIKEGDSYDIAHQTEKEKPNRAQCLEKGGKIKIKNQDKERGVCHFCPPSLKPAPHIFQCNIPVVRMVASRSFSGFLWGGKKQNSMIFTSVYWINFRCHPFLAWPLCLPGSSTQILE